MRPPERAAAIAPIESKTALLVGDEGHQRRAFLVVNSDPSAGCCIGDGQCLHAAVDEHVGSPCWSRNQRTNTGFAGVDRVGSYR